MAQDWTIIKLTIIGHWFWFTTQTCLPSWEVPKKILTSRSSSITVGLFWWQILDTLQRIVSWLVSDTFLAFPKYLMYLILTYKFLGFCVSRYRYNINITVKHENGQVIVIHKAEKAEKCGHLEIVTRQLPVEKQSSHLGIFQPDLHIYLFIWVNYSNSRNWNKAILGWFPLHPLHPIYVFINIYIYILPFIATN